MSLINSASYFIWKYISASDDCPYCGVELDTHGFEGHNKTYSCYNEECEFNIKIETEGVKK